MTTRAHIDHHAALLAQWRDKVREIEDGTSPMLVRRLARTPDADREKTIAYKIFTYEGLIAQAEVEIAWAKRGLSSSTGSTTDAQRPLAPSRQAKGRI